MDPITLGCIAGGVIGGISALGWWIQSDWKLTRLLAHTPRVQLADLQEGTFGRVVGRAEQLDDVLIAPITGRRCVYWRVRVLDAMKVEQEIINEERGIPFVVDDGSARAVVDPAGAIIGMNEDGRDEAGWQKVTNTPEHKFLAHHTGAARDVNNLHFREGIIEVGETIAILGTVAREREPDAAYRGAPPPPLRMTSWRGRPMMISDRPEAKR